MSDGIVFAERVRAALAVARRAGLSVPAFRSPPKDPNVNRSLRWRDDGSSVVAVRIKGRTLAELEDDIVAGIVAVNRLDGIRAAEFRASCAEAFDVF